MNDFGRTKYNRKIKDVNGPELDGEVDVYSVLEAFDVRCSATAHAIKKLLCAGIRGKGNKVQDLQESKVAIDRAIVIAENNAKEGKGPVEISGTGES